MPVRKARKAPKVLVRGRAGSSPTTLERIKIVERNAKLIRRFKAKLRQDTYVLPERRRIPFNV